MGQDAKAQVAFDLLRRDILNGTHKPGQPLRIAHLSARYSIGATALREVLMRLAQASLVVAVANKGWQVAPVSLDEFKDLLAARLTLETALLADAMAVGALEWETNLVTAHYRLAQAVIPLGEADTLAYRQTWIAMHDRFHIALLAGAQSLWLKRFHAQILEQLQRHHQAVMAQFPPVGKMPDPLMAQAFSMPNHTELMVAALDRDTASAKTALQRHNDVANDVFRHFLGKGFPTA